MCYLLFYWLFFQKAIWLLRSLGLSLFANSVLPSLLPFFIATELLSYSGFIPYLGKALNKFMRPIFNVPGEGAFAFIMGIISGYPIGAKIVTNFRQNGICTKEEGERLIAFTNNSGPLFIIGTVGISLFFDTRTGILLFLSHILACFTVGFVFRFWKKNTNQCKLQKYTLRRLNSVNKKAISPIIENSIECSFTNLGTILSKSISNAISNVVMIGRICCIVFCYCFYIRTYENIRNFSNSILSNL